MSINQLTEKQLEEYKRKEKILGELVSALREVDALGYRFNTHQSTTMYYPECKSCGAGMAMKHDDMFGAYACSDCHDAIDRRHNRALDRDYVRLAHLDGMVRTQKILLSMGLIKL